MPKKKWYKQKTTWAGLASIVAGVGAVCTDQQETGVSLIATGIIGVFLRQGIEGTKVDPE